MKSKINLKLWQLIISLVFFITSIYSKESNDRSFVVVIPSYNNKQWFKLNLNSVIHQRYSKFRIVYVNDCSKDGTGLLVEEYLKKKKLDYRVINFNDHEEINISKATEKFSGEVNSQENFIILVNNVRRVGALANLYRSIYSCKDDEIIVTVDGDDWLSDAYVIDRLNKTYNSGQVWMTHGSLAEYPSGVATWCEAVPEDTIKRNAFREFKCPSHLRTFYTWLFKKIELDDLLYQGNFFTMTWDMAMMYPMAEMAGDRQAFVSQVNYIYNMTNPINDNKVDAQLQNDLDYMIRRKERYQKLQKDEIPVFLQN